MAEFLSQTLLMLLISGLKIFVLYKRNHQNYGQSSKLAEAIAVLTE